MLRSSASGWVLLLCSCIGPAPVVPVDGGYDRARGNAFEGPILFDDERVRTLDPAELPAIAGACRPPVLGIVTAVTDGDTLHVAVPSERQTWDVRLIGVNAPEVAHPSDGGLSERECYGDEAHAFSELLRSRFVWLTFDQGCFDPFGRSLAYVWIGPGTGDLWQRQLVARGFAEAVEIPPNTAYAADLAGRRAAAQAAGVGLWGACR